jgi:hypothetical protein
VGRNGKQDGSTGLAELGRTSDQDEGAAEVTDMEIVPGVSIGPFRLGMTRRKVESIGLDPKALGMRIQYDSVDRCAQLEIRVFNNAATNKHLRSQD